MASSHHLYISASNEDKESSVWGMTTEYKAHHHLWHECQYDNLHFLTKDKNQSKYEVAIQSKTKPKLNPHIMGPALGELDASKPFL